MNWFGLFIIVLFYSPYYSMASDSVHAVAYGNKVTVSDTKYCKDERCISGKILAIWTNGFIEHNDLWLTEAEKSRFILSLKGTTPQENEIYKTREQNLRDRNIELLRFLKEALLQSKEERLSKKLSSIDWRRERLKQDEENLSAFINSDEYKSSEPIYTIKNGQEEAQVLRSEYIKGMLNKLENAVSVARQQLDAESARIENPNWFEEENIHYRNKIEWISERLESGEPFNLPDQLRSAAYWKFQEYIHSVHGGHVSGNEFGRAPVEATKLAIEAGIEDGSLVLISHEAQSAVTAFVTALEEEITTITTKCEVNSGRKCEIDHDVLFSISPWEWKLQGH